MLLSLDLHWNQHSNYNNLAKWYWGTVVIAGSGGGSRGGMGDVAFLSLTEKSPLSGIQQWYVQ